MPEKGKFSRIIKSLEDAQKELHRSTDDNIVLPPHEGSKNQQENIEINNMIGDIEFVGFYNKLTGQKPHICLDWEKTIELFKGFDFE